MLFSFIEIVKFGVTFRRATHQKPNHQGFGIRSDWGFALNRLSLWVTQSLPIRGREIGTIEQIDFK
jgi:hypothetical protein